MDGTGVGGALAEASRSGSPVRARSSSVIDENGTNSMSSTSIDTASIR